MRTEATITRTSNVFVSYDCGSAFCTHRRISPLRPGKRSEYYAVGKKYPLALNSSRNNRTPLSGSGFTGQLRVILKWVFIPSTPCFLTHREQEWKSTSMSTIFQDRNGSPRDEKGDLIFSNQIFMTFGEVTARGRHCRELSIRPFMRPLSVDWIVYWRELRNYR